VIYSYIESLKSQDPLKSLCTRCPSLAVPALPQKAEWAFSPPVRACGGRRAGNERFSRTTVTPWTAKDTAMLRTASSSHYLWQEVAIRWSGLRTPTNCPSA